MLGLKTVKGAKTLKLAPSIFEGLQKEKVNVGDVIYIEANSGAVKRVGRSDAYASEFDLEAEEYVPVPKGDVHKKKEVVQVSNFKKQRSTEIYVFVFDRAIVLLQTESSEFAMDEGHFRALTSPYLRDDPLLLMRS